MLTACTTCESRAAPLVGAKRSRKDQNLLSALLAPSGALTHAHVHATKRSCAVKHDPPDTPSRHLKPLRVFLPIHTRATRRVAEWPRAGCSRLHTVKMQPPPAPSGAPPPAAPNAPVHVPPSPSLPPPGAPHAPPPGAPPLSASTAPAPSAARLLARALEDEAEQLRQALAASLGDRSLVDEDQAIAASIEAHQQRRDLRHTGDQEDADMQRALAASQSQVVPYYPSPS